MKNFFVVNHPLVKRDLTILRDKNSNQEQFRNALRRVSLAMAIEISRDFSLIDFSIDTPLETTIGYKLHKEICLIPILRAGLSMLDGFLTVLPDASVGHIGIQRNETTLQPEDYYFKTPRNIGNMRPIILDPMLATGGSASAAVSFVKQKGAKDIILACVIAAPEGVKKLEEEHRDVKIFAAALDRQLNDKGYILPGLGDAGDRTFGTL
jgi:uracil phosphoribosyltransferase